jgi:hypothetical protein
MLLMPMFYLPPLSYMALMCAAEKVCLEAEENYIKSTHRNRCGILGSNGSIDLSIPIVGGRDHHQLYRDVIIDYDSDWQHRHRMSIVSCYGSAPFFEHYMPHLEPFYDRRHSSLFDYNKDLLHLLIRLMKLDVSILYTEAYEKYPHDMVDVRKLFKPGKEIKEISLSSEKWQVKEVDYIRVFDCAVDPLSLSCLDLLFNEGPQSKSLLKQMVTRV